MRLLDSERDRALKHIERCDKLFDGKREDGTQSSLPPDREFAYNQMRLLALELIEKLERPHRWRLP